MSSTQNSTAPSLTKTTQRRDFLLGWLADNAGRLYTIDEMKAAGFAWPEHLDFYDMSNNQTRLLLNELHSAGLVRRGSRAKQQKRPFRMVLGNKDRDSLGTCVKKVYCWGVKADETV